MQKEIIESIKLLIKELQEYNKNKSELKKTYSVKDIIKVYGISEKQAYNILADKKLKKNKNGKTYLVLKEDLDRYMQYYVFNSR